MYQPTAITASRNPLETLYFCAFPAFLQRQALTRMRQLDRL